MTMAQPTRGCSADGCTRKHNSHGLCSMHGIRLERHGDVSNPGAFTYSEPGHLRTSAGSPVATSSGWSIATGDYAPIAAPGPTGISITSSRYAVAAGTP